MKGVYALDTKKIFVLGNGFDLAHYLPTAYVHFMDAMITVEESEENAELGFDDLFHKYVSDDCSGREKVFFQKTRKLYKTDDLRLSSDTVKELRGDLKSNGWFQHFKHHLTDVDTWIDFENEIEKSLISFDLVFSIDFNTSTISDNLNSMYSNIEPSVNIESILEDEKIFNWRVLDQTGLKAKGFISLLKNFGILKRVYGHIIYEKERRYGGHAIYTRQDSERLTLEDYEVLEEYREKKINEYTTQTNIKRSFDNIVETRYLNRNSNLYISFKEIEIYKKILKDLEFFSEIFTSYISLVINQLEPVNCFDSLVDFRKEVGAVYTFNYSNTFERLYPNIFVDKYSNVQYIHGSAECKNIVLGISDLEEDLKKYKIYGFVKTFQKLIKNTDYKFLDNTNIKAIKSIPREAGQLRAHYEVVIWGHSLDTSDAEYIQEMFALNDSRMLNRVVIKIWYHSSPHAQLANLMYIIGKDVIQEWMKKGWLVFETAPDIYKENGY